MHSSMSYKPSEIKVLFCGLALGCLLVTLLASRSLVATGAAVAHKIQQPRRGLQGSLNVRVGSGRLDTATERDPEMPEVVLEATDAVAVEPPVFSSVKCLHHSPLRRQDTSPKEMAKHGKNSWFSIFENVIVDWSLNGDGQMGIHFYHSANETVPDNERIRSKEFRYDWGKQLRVSTHYHSVPKPADSPLTSCSTWVNEPAIIFHVPFPDNFFHFMNDGVLNMLHTLVDTGLAPAHVQRMVGGDASFNTSNPADGECILATPVKTEVIQIALRADAFHQPWSHLLDHISTSRSIVHEQRGRCFRKLVLGNSMLLDAFWSEQSFDAETRRLRKPALQAAQRFLMRSALTHKLQHLPPQADAAAIAAAGCTRIAQIIQGQQPGRNASTDGWRSGQTLPRVTLGSRTGPGVTRALLNEADVARFIEAHWEVELVSTNFKASLFDTVDLMQSTDVFVAMHGAGMTNVVFLPEASTAVQLMPYGWNYTAPDGQLGVVRGGLYRQMGDIQNIKHHFWFNSDASRSYLHKEWFDKANRSAEFTLHPTDKLERPVDDNPFQGWIYQDTLADLTTLEPVLSGAFASAGILRREPPLPFEETYQPPAEPPMSPPKIKTVAPEQKKLEQKQEEAKKVPVAADAAATPDVETPWTGIVCTGKFC